MLRQDDHAVYEGDGMETNNSTQTTEEWPSRGVDYEHGTLRSDTCSPIDVTGLFNNSDYNSDDPSKGLQPRDMKTDQEVALRRQQGSDEEPYVAVEAPWDVLASSVVGNYQSNLTTISDSGVLNAEEGRGEFWRRIVKMPRFKRKGVQRRRGRRNYKMRVTRTEEATNSSKKRKASSDPWYFNAESSEGYTSESSTCRNMLATCKRLCAENRT